jgi:outer membrane protein
MALQSGFTKAAALAVLLLGATGVQAADPAPATFKAGDFMVRVRGLGVLPDVSSKVSAPVGGKVDISNDFIPEVDFSYFVTPNFSLELIAGTSRHSVTDKGSVVGDTQMGTVRLLPPTLTAQWHFLPNERINPYVGAGINYTIFYDAKNGSQHSGIRYDDNFGYALQAGVDVNITGNWYANLDVKKIFLKTTAHVSAAKAIPTTAKVDIDPWIVGIGIGYKF